MSRCLSLNVSAVMNWQLVKRVSCLRPMSGAKARQEMTICVMDVNSAGLGQGPLLVPPLQCPPTARLTQQASALDLRQMWVLLIFL